MQNVFLSSDARQRENWRQAFPTMTAARLDDPLPDVGVLWVLLPAGQSVELVSDLSRQLAGRLLVVLADEPDEDEAMAVLAAGAAGYCNGHAAPQVLLQIAAVVENGGLWIGQGLMQRLLSATARLLPQDGVESTAWRGGLTSREQEVAIAVARGASNKEIARQLNITERTVKSHVSAMLEKFGARDRLQLSLVINGVDRRR